MRACVIEVKLISSRLWLSVPVTIEPVAPLLSNTFSSPGCCGLFPSVKIMSAQETTGVRREMQIARTNRFITVECLGQQDCDIYKQIASLKNCPPTCVAREQLRKSTCSEISAASQVLLPALALVRSRPLAHRERLLRERDSIVSTKNRRKSSKRLSGRRTLKLSPLVHSSGSNTQRSKRSNGLD